MSRGPCGPGQQPQRRPGLGPVPRPLCGSRTDDRKNRHPRRRLPGRPGRGPARRRRTLGPDRAQTADRPRDAVQAAALALVSPGIGFGTRLIAAILLGAGTAMVYPALLAAIGDGRMPGMPSIPPGRPLVFGRPASAMGSVLIPQAQGATRSAFTVRPKATEAHANLRRRRFPQGSGAQQPVRCRFGRSCR